MGIDWMRFTADSTQRAGENPVPFALRENGTVRVSESGEEEMDIAAEQFAREMFITNVR